MRTIFIRLAAAATVAAVIAATTSKALALCLWWMFCDCGPWEILLGIC